MSSARCVPLEGAYDGFFADATCAGARVAYAGAVEGCPAPKTAIDFRGTCDGAATLALWELGPRVTSTPYFSDGASCTAIAPAGLSPLPGARACRPRDLPRPHHDDARDRTLAQRRADAAPRPCSRSPRMTHRRARSRSAHAFATGTYYRKAAGGCEPRPTASNDTFWLLGDAVELDAAFPPVRRTVK